MATSDSLDFLNQPVTPVQAGAEPAEDPADRLPQSEADRLLGLDGVDGAWIERDAGGGRSVVLHYSRSDTPAHLPAQVLGLPVRIVGGEPIRAGG